MMLHKRHIARAAFAYIGLASGRGDTGSIPFTARRQAQLLRVHAKHRRLFWEEAFGSVKTTMGATTSENAYSISDATKIHDPFEETPLEIEAHNPFEETTLEIETPVVETPDITFDNADDATLEEDLALEIETEAIPTQKNLFIKRLQAYYGNDYPEYWGTFIADADAEVGSNVDSLAWQDLDNKFDFIANHEGVFDPTEYQHLKNLATPLNDAEHNLFMKDYLRAVLDDMGEQLIDGDNEATVDALTKGLLENPNWADGLDLKNQAVLQLMTHNAHGIDLDPSTIAYKPDDPTWYHQEESVGFFASNWGWFVGGGAVLLGLAAVALCFWCRKRRASARSVGAGGVL